MTTVEVPPPFAVLDLMLGSMVTQTIYVAAELGIADLLHTEGPLTAEEIARKVDADPASLDRLMRFLCSREIFQEQGGTYALSPRAHALRSDAPMSMRGMARLMGHPTHWSDWTGFLETIRTGQPAVPEQHGGMGMFELLMTDQEYGRTFFGGMTDLSDTETMPLVTGFDWSRFGTIVDVGAGRGGLLAAILQAAPGSRGVCFDERAPGNGAGEVLEAAGVADRVTVETGSFFGPAPAGGDAYLLKHIVHDWPHDRAVEILRNVRAAAKPDSTLLIMEFVLPEDGSPHIGKLIDLWLLLLLGGGERTTGQYRELLAEAGWELEEVVPTQAAIAIVVARPV